MAWLRRRVVDMFQFTRPRGARRVAWLRRRAVDMFQFTRPRGARLDVPRVDRFPRLFQFTRPRGARQGYRRDTARDSCFNSRAREGRDCGPDEQSLVSYVSIHAPARGATSWTATSAKSRLFQFTRPRGARPAGRRAAARLSMFQFTRPRGARPATRWPTYCDFGFQFTRPRGARLAQPFGRYSYRCFNSRAREGRDDLKATLNQISGGFQFTRPRGARHGSPANAIWGTVVSIHAPARGATSRKNCSRNQSSFNSRAREGRDVPMISGDPAATWVSIHAPARGATLKATINKAASKFQFTRPRGARPRRKGRTR